MAKTKYVYFFGAGTADGGAALKPLLGGKGANLAEMSSRGFNVPAGFTITTEGVRPITTIRKNIRANLRNRLSRILRKSKRLRVQYLATPKNRSSLQSVRVRVNRCRV